MELKYQNSPDCLKKNYLFVERVQGNTSKAFSYDHQADDIHFRNKGFGESGWLLLTPFADFIDVL